MEKEFTSIEQSELLMLLGVPLNSADMYYQNALPEPKVIPANRRYVEYTKSLTGINREIWIMKPCWSVGRLMRIINTCVSNKNGFRFLVYENMNLHKTKDFTGVLATIVIKTLVKQNQIDFKKWGN